MNGPNRSRRYRTYPLSMWEEQAPDQTGRGIWPFTLERAQQGEQRRALATLEEVMLFVKQEGNRKLEG